LGGGVVVQSIVVRGIAKERESSRPTRCFTGGGFIIIWGQEKKGAISNILG